MRTLVPFLLFLQLGAPSNLFQAQSRPAHPREFAANLVVPQARSPVFATGTDAVRVTEVSAAVDILEQVATTTLDLYLTNAFAHPLEAEVLIPVPAAAHPIGFSFQGPGLEPSAELLEREKARASYEAIVARTRDPAMVEFAGCNLLRSSVFPVPARGMQKVRLIYEQLLPRDVDRIDYLLPRTESIDYQVPWRLALKIVSKAPIGTVYSPSHLLEISRESAGSLTARLAPAAATEPGPFRVSYLLQGDGISASLLAYPDPKIGGGYFLLLGSAPSKLQAESPASQRREVILVLDRSGSMGGGKLEQACAAACQVIDALEEGELFNVIVYSDTIEPFAPEPVVKSAATAAAARAYLRGVRPQGGTNLHDALAEALRHPPHADTLGIVLFLTDGLPTVGPTSERAIRDLATRGNPHRRRVFTFGVGADVNTPLLDRLALDTRATATYVMPTEDVEVRVGGVFRRLAGPVLSEPTIQIGAAARESAAVRVHDLLPSRLPDLFDGDQLVLLGRYSGTGPLKLELQGTYFGRPRNFRYRFDLDGASVANAFVPRLWAARRIAALTDAIRDLGVDGGASHPLLAQRRSPIPLAGPRFGPTAAKPDPRAQELVSEVLRLSREFGILTEYTAFLALEGTDLSQPAQVLAEAYRNFDERAMRTRWGNASLNQSLNNASHRTQNQLRNRNDFLDASLNRVQIGTVQQVNDHAYFRRGSRWIDSALVADADSTPRRVISVESAEFRELAARLAAEGRPGIVSLGGEVLLQVDGERVLIR